MDTNKNSYTIIYSIVMVVLVAAVLAFVSLSLKDKQNENISNEKKQYLLASVGLGADANFAEVIKEAIVVDGNGKVVNSATTDIANSEAFNISTSEQTSLMKDGAPKEDLRLPVFVASLPDGSQAYIFSAYGAGLWGPIWGWVSLKTDLNTISGVKFDHSGETPGLGAEITTANVQNSFKGKTIFEGADFVSVSMRKGGATNNHEVDAISGGTKTCDGVNAMIKSSIEGYLPYINANKSNN